MEVALIVENISFWNFQSPAILEKQYSKIERLMLLRTTYYMILHYKVPYGCTEVIRKFTELILCQISFQYSHVNF